MHIYSQVDSNRYWGLNISSGLHTTLSECVYDDNLENSTGYRLDIAQERYLFTPSVSYNIDKHAIYIGPRIYLPENNYKRFGAQLTYDYLLNETLKKVNFTLSCDVIYSYENYEKERRLTIDTLLYMSNNTMKNNYLHSLIFFGLKTFIANNIYFDLRAGMGIGLQSHKSTDKVNELPNYDDLNVNTRLFNNPEFNSMIKIGLGYNFK